MSPQDRDVANLGQREIAELDKAAIVLGEDVARLAGILTRRQWEDRPGNRRTGDHRDRFH